MNLVTVQSKSTHLCWCLLAKHDILFRLYDISSYKDPCNRLCFWFLVAACCPFSFSTLEKTCWCAASPPQMWWLQRHIPVTALPRELRARPSPLPLPPSPKVSVFHVATRRFPRCHGRQPGTRRQSSTTEFKSWSIQTTLSLRWRQQCDLTKTFQNAEKKTKCGQVKKYSINVIIFQHCNKQILPYLFS